MFGEELGDEVDGDVLLVQHHTSKIGMMTQAGKSADRHPDEPEEQD